MGQQRLCFVIMPFKPELNYFYLYLRKHIEEVHNVSCFRGDNDVLTVPILEKIERYIESADVLIADCTGRNPNVFYELGIAHTLNKKVILISMDDVKEAPTDIRHYEFINYRLDNHEEFLNKLDNALRNVFVEHYEHLYDKAISIVKAFQTDNHLQIEPVRKEIFIAKVMANERRRPVPDLKDDLLLKQFLLPLIIESNADFNILEKVTKWLSKDQP